MFEYLDRRYALALYEVAEEKGKVQEYLNDLREICDLIDNNKDFYEVVKHPQISTKQKKRRDDYAAMGRTTIYDRA